jgi:ubiquinone biosynthesis protein
MSTMRAVYTNLRAARTAIKDAGRVRDIALVLIGHGLGHFVERWNVQDRSILRKLVEKRTEAEPLTIFARTSKALQDLGPTFVKLGQILSTRPDLVPQALCDELMALQDNVSPITLAEARQVLEESLGVPVEEVFDDFSAEPLASASIAQVHTARLKTGEEVVVKIQRPGIREKIQSDLHILFWVAKKIEETIPEAAAFDPVAIAREFERAICRELDFKFEATNLSRFARTFADWEQIYIPVLYDEHSSDTVLIMERLRAIKITDAPAAGHDMEPIAKECVRMLFKMVFEDGFFHGDLHPGNLLILEDGRVGVIDFGLVGRMNQAMKDTMADLLLNIVTENYEGVARSFFDICVRRGPVDYDAFEQDVVDLMGFYFENASLAEVDFGAFLRDLVEGAIRHQVQIPPDFTMFFKAIMTVEGIGKIVSPDLDLVSECRPYVERLIAQRYSPQRVMRVVTETLQHVGRFARQFPVAANQMLDQLDEGRLNLGIEYPAQEALEAARDRRLNRGVLASLVGVLLLCGTLARDHDATLFGMPGISLICFTVGGFLGARLLARVLSGGRW